MITNRIRYSLFPQFAIVCFVLFFLGGYLALVKGFELGWGMILLGLLPFGVTSGSQIDTSSGRIRSYTSILGKKVGQWEHLQAYPEVVMLSKRKSFGMGAVYQPGLRSVGPRGLLTRTSQYKTESGKHYVYEIYAADEKHMGMILLAQVYRKDLAEEFIRAILNSTNLSWVSYSPYGRFPKKKLG